MIKKRAAKTWLPLKTRIQNLTSGTPLFACKRFRYTLTLKHYGKPDIACPANLTGFTKI
jgi:hypothetical protein